MGCMCTYYFVVKVEQHHSMCWVAVADTRKAEYMYTVAQWFVLDHGNIFLECSIIYIPL